MSGTQFKTYYVKNLADSGQPYEVRAASKYLAAKVTVGRDTKSGWTFGVWTESEWRNESSPTEYSASDF